jgi:hypothetical protein
VAPPAPPDLPPVGPELTLSLRGSAALRLDAGSAVELDLSGTIRMTVEERLRYGPAGVRLRISGVDLAAASDVLGTVRMSLADDDVAMLSRVELAGDPPLLRHVMAFEVTLTIERPPAVAGPLDLTSAQPPTLVCVGLERFPPRRAASYELQRPVELTPEGALDEVVGELLALSLTSNRARGPG